MKYRVTIEFECGQLLSKVALNEIKANMIESINKYSNLTAEVIKATASKLREG